MDTRSNWVCGNHHHKVSVNVNFKKCIVINDDLDAQAVLVVQNKASVAVTIEGETFTNFGGNEDCAVSTLNPGFTRGCFGPTRHLGGTGPMAEVRLNLNTVDDWL
ncbi:hypothetical protein V1L54_01675 [Streptomyces sp. TRM 70361]|uniref:hypothetical protein n=1 Tax=Streptomyces sp. TRM 70361 TaxID=3116553 RepID=UPI002E7B157A|nr:hypothetical protein [Streptomyces sp. TRM 70361]MEE1938138.1 hypothetical protein [Streptomyces sp. TRM 70361]